MSYDPHLYALTHRGNPGDVAFYARQISGARTVLELGCGFGRTLGALADVDGVQRVVGLDIDEGLLALAPSHPRVSVVQGDMREFDLGVCFDRIYAPHGSMWCLTSDDDVRRCLERVANHLEPDGLFIFDAWAADEMHDVADPTDVEDDLLEPVTTLDGPDGPTDVFERSTWDREAQRIDVTYLYVPTSGGQQREGTIDQHYLLSPQVEQLLAEHGLQLRSTFGDFDGKPYEPTDDHLIVVAERAPLSSRR